MTSPTAPSSTDSPLDVLARIDLGRVRELLGTPSEAVQRKIADHLGVQLQAFIARSPFLTLATAGEDGRLDNSPRGDAPGFVQILSSTRLAIPDRLGNRLVDSYRNILIGGRVGLTFFVPGAREVARVNGRAFLTDDPTLLATMPADGKVPLLAVVVDVEEAFIHCGRAILRSGLWRSESQVLGGQVPTIGQIFIEQVKLPGVTAEMVDAESELDYRQLY